MIALILLSHIILKHLRKALLDFMLINNLDLQGQLIWIYKDNGIASILFSNFKYSIYIFKASIFFSYFHNSCALLYRASSYDICLILLDL